MSLANVICRCLLLILASTLVSCSHAEFGKWFDQSVGYNKGYAPDQPLKFEHSKHAGDLKIPCQYCHTQARRARTAGVPSLNICWNCHFSIRQVAGKPSAEIKKLVDAYENDKSIEWARVHMLPDHARFNHAPHIKVLSMTGKVGESCKTCHGEVQNMKKMKQHSSLSMGWCVNCHRENHTDKKGPLNCSTCHY